MAIRKKTNKRTAINRLKKWEHAIRTFKETPTKEFNMSVVHDRTTNGTCSSAACAWGWLPTIFPRQWVMGRGKKVNEIDGIKTFMYVPRPKVGSRIAFFGINEYVWDDIISPCGDTSTKAVADRIKMARLELERKP